MAQTAEELREELARLEREEKDLKKMRYYDNEEERKKNYGKSRLYNGTKISIVLIIVYLVIVGTFGSMKIGPFSDFSMDDFVKFLSAFSPIFITLTGSIGIGGIAKNVAKSIAAKKNSNSITWGEDLAKSGKT